MNSTSQARVAAWLEEISDFLPNKILLDSEGLAVVTGESGFEFLIQVISPEQNGADGDGIVVLRTVLGPLPGPGRETALFRLMVYNVYAQERSGGTFGVDPNAGQIVYTLAVPVAWLNPNSFLELMERFVENSLTLGEEVSALIQSVAADAEQTEQDPNAQPEAVGPGAELPSAFVRV
ncbi:hypothetical protein DB346_09345 [Verrucomicrobia bacterium LW23]|nr:hypothetical protein DB346_09345 [Verrucomicrobia bacterium LW23]